jgi:hypothetical protein
VTDGAVSENISQLIKRAGVKIEVKSPGTKTWSKNLE